MNQKFGLLSALLLFTKIVLCSADPPPNDDFVNRIVLSGDDIAFTGTLAEATIESANGRGEVRTLFSLAGTVWWSWTATQSSPVILESLDCFIGSFENLTVWPTPDPQMGFPVITNSSDGGIRAVGSLYIPENVPRTYLIFSAAEGATYYFQLGGFMPYNLKTPTNSFRFRLTASSTPIIQEQPNSLTVSSNGSALFTIGAAGSPPLSFQWRFNGQDIPGAQGAVLGLTNLIPAQAGGYSVVVTNNGGAMTAWKILSSHALPVGE